MQKTARKLRPVSAPGFSIFQIAPPLTLAFALLFSGCGGGSQTTVTPPPPPPPEDFGLSVGPNVLTLQQGGEPRPMTLAFTGIGGENAFTVTVSFVNPPAGITLYPSGPITLSSPADVESIFVLATASAAVGNLTLNISGTNGQVTHTAALPITVNAGAPFQVILSPPKLSLADGVPGGIQASLNVTSGSAPAVTLSTETDPSRWDLAPKISGSGSGPFTLTFASSFTAPPVSNLPVFITATDSANNTVTAVLLISTVDNFPAVTALPRGNFIRTDETPGSAVYDMSRKLLFVTVPNLNEVRVYSSVDQHQVATIPVERPGAIDESADGTAVFVGGLGKVFTIDPASLQVTGLTLVQQTFTFPQTPQKLPVQLVTLSTGEVLILSYSGGNILLWNPAANTMQANDPPGFTATLLLTRSADHGTVFVASAAGVAALNVLYNAIAKTYGQSAMLPESNVALSPDGSRIVLVSTPGNGLGGDLYVYDSGFNVLYSEPLLNIGVAAMPIYGLDGKSFYLFFQQPDVGSMGVAYDAQTLLPQGVFSMAMQYQLAVQTPFAIDETGLIFGVGVGPGNSGLAVMDASHPGALLASSYPPAPPPWVFRTY